MFQPRTPTDPFVISNHKIIDACIPISPPFPLEHLLVIEIDHPGDVLGKRAAIEVARPRVAACADTSAIYFEYHILCLVSYRLCFLASQRDKGFKFGVEPSVIHVCFASMVVFFNAMLE